MRCFRLALLLTCGSAVVAVTGPALATSPPIEPGAARSAIQRAYGLDRQKAATSDIRSAFQRVVEEYPASAEAAEAAFRLGMLSVREKDVPSARTALEGVARRYPNTSWAAEAAYTLGHFDIRDKKFDTAIARLAALASDSNAAPEVADEALLETGFLRIQNSFAGQYTTADGKIVDRPDAEARVALLEEGQKTLIAVAEKLGSLKDVQGTHQTAAAFAECGVAEVCLIQGLPDQAETWYRAALARNTGVQPSVRTLASLGLGIALFRQGLLPQADEQFMKVTSFPSTGRVLHGLLVPDFLVSEAWMWHAAVAQRMGDDQEARLAMASSVDRLAEAETVSSDAKAILEASTRGLNQLKGSALGTAPAATLLAKVERIDLASADAPNLSKDSSREVTK